MGLIIAFSANRRLVVAITGKELLKINKKVACGEG